MTDVPNPTISVSLDIKPGSESNPLKLKFNSKGKSRSAGGVLPVAILTTDDFDATLAFEETVLLGDPDLMGAVPPIKSSVEDVNGDGRPDLLLHFSIQELVSSFSVDEQSFLLLLTGETFDGTGFDGLDLVTIKP